MEPHFKNYQINYKFQEKDRGYYSWKLRKRKVKHQKLFITTLVDQPEPSVQLEQAELEHLAVKENFMMKLTKNQTYLFPEILVPYLNNPSKETMFGSNKIKVQHETMKLQNEDVMLENT